MSNKYENTLFDNVKLNIPVKHSENKEYFFRVDFQDIWYISIQTFLLLSWFYLILWWFWFLIYQQHFYAATWLVVINIIFSLIILLRDQNSWKNVIDMLYIIKRYMNKKQIYIFRGRKQDLFSKYQKDYLKFNKIIQKNNDK